MSSSRSNPVTVSMRNFHLKEREESLKKQQLQSYIKAFKGLDNNVNQFFLNYQNLVRPSKKMADVWSAVMYCRTQMVCALGHMQDQERYLRGDYKKKRIQEKANCIEPLRIHLSRAVGVLALFSKNIQGAEGNEWYYNQIPVLEELVGDLSSQIITCTDSWRDFLLSLYEVPGARPVATDDTAQAIQAPQGAGEDHSYEGVTLTAYMDHLQTQKVKHERLLVRMEAERVKSNIPAWEKEYKTLISKIKGENNAEKKQQLQWKMKYLLTMLSDVEPTIQKAKINRQLTMLLKLVSDYCLDFLQFVLPRDLPNKKPYQQGLLELGPFGVSPLHLPTRHFRAAPTFGALTGPDACPYGYIELNKKWDKEVPNRHYKEFKELFPEKKPRCNLSQLTKIKTAKSKYGKLHIPTKATKFAWVFPTLSDDDVREADPKTRERIVAYKQRADAISCVMATGGFAYFDSKNRFLGLNGLYPFGDDMFFDGPYEFTHGKTYVNEDKRTQGGHQMQDITIDVLSDQGCKRFGWINEDTHLKITTGAFYYIYTGDHQEANYFKFLDYNEAKVEKLKDGNTPGIQYLNTLEDRFRAEWGEARKVKHGRVARFANKFLLSKLPKADEEDLQVHATVA